MIICGLRPGTSEPIASCASGAGNTPCQQPDGSLVATAGQKIQFGILGSDGRCTVQKMSAFEEILRISAPFQTRGRNHSHDSIVVRLRRLSQIAFTPTTRSIRAPSAQIA
jgi:hypothetical protein